MMASIDTAARPAIGTGFRLQWEPAQEVHVLLYPEGMVRLSHSAAEYDFGFATVKLLKHLGVVKATTRGAVIPDGVQAGVSPF